jgi:hypothetical protein
MQQGTQGWERVPTLDRGDERACHRRPKLCLGQPGAYPERMDARSQQDGVRLVGMGSMFRNT